MIIKQNISEQVFELLKKDIIEGKWQPGEKIPSENELTEMLGVSRISIRHAIQKLIALGFLEAQQGKGTFVKLLDVSNVMNSLLPMLALNYDNILQITEFRRILEVESAGLAARYATPETIANLEMHLAKMRETATNPELYPEADMAFHVEIARATKNKIILKTVEILGDALMENQRRMFQLSGTAEHGLEYHAKILEAIKNKDVRLAKKVMLEHIMFAIKRINYIIRKEQKALAAHSPASGKR